MDAGGYPLYFALSRSSHEMRRPMRLCISQIL